MKDKAKKNIIVTHRIFPGAGQDLYRYFKNNKMPVLLVEHSFESYPGRRTTFSNFDGQKEIIKHGLDFKIFPDLICYIKDFIYSLYAAIRYPNKCHIYFGCGGFNVLPGIILKLLGRVEKVVFYTIDFSPNRFDSFILNRLYLIIDKICVVFSNRTWNLSERMVEGRQIYNNMSAKKFDRQRTVPIGLWLNDLLEERKENINEKKLIFSGRLCKPQGIQLVLESIPEIVKKIDGFKFFIIGDGDYKDYLLDLVRNLNIQKFVEYAGSIYDKKSLLRELCFARVGVAPYAQDKNLIAYFGDVTKPKVYFSCGLPVIITKFPRIHEEVTRRNLGLVIDYDKAQLTDAVIRLMTDDNLYLTCKRNVEEFISDLDWNKIFSSAIGDLENA